MCEVVLWLGMKVFYGICCPTVFVCIWAIILLIYESSFKGLLQTSINYAYISSNGILQFTQLVDALSMELNGLITRLG